jgi:hypothetical protein
VGNKNAITYKECFKLIKEGKMWLGNGNNLSMVYKTPYENNLVDNIKFCAQKGYHGKNYIKVPAVSWFTNLDHKKRNEEIILYKNYNKKEYPKYDNYDAINVDKVKDIPCDYDGVMGVPITFLSQFNPKQFEIVALGNSRDNFTPNKDYINPKKVMKDGKIVNGGAINCVLAIETNKKPVGEVYYTSSNSSYLIPPYARILIKKI